MITSNEMSPADIAAVTNNGNGNNGLWGGGDGAWWLIVLFLFAFVGGNGFGGWGGNANAGGGAVPYHDPAYTDGMIMHKRNPNTGRYMSHSDETDHSRTRTMQHLERMLDQAATDEERKTIISCMNKL